MRILTRRLVAVLRSRQPLSILTIVSNYSKMLPKTLDTSHSLSPSPG